MKVTKCEIDEQGNTFFNVIATDDEVRCMINIALSALVAMGTIPDSNDEAFNIDLSTIAIEDMFKA